MEGLEAYVTLQQAVNEARQYLDLELPVLDRFVSILRTLCSRRTKKPT